MDFNEILQLSTIVKIRKIDEYIQIILRNKLTSSTWNLIEMILISFEGKGEIFEIKTSNRCMVHANEHNEKLLNLCQSYENVYTCTFRLIHNTSCELDTFAKNRAIQCEFRPVKLPRFMGTNQTRFYVKIEEATIFNWIAEGPIYSFALEKEA